VTIVAWQRECLFGEVVGGETRLNGYGEIIQEWWQEMPNHFPNVELGAFVSMPNHIHGIIIIHDARRGTVSVPINEPNFDNISSVHYNDETVKQDVNMKRGEMTSPLRSPTLGQVIAYFKYQSTKEMNTLDGTGAITKFWQCNYYERIIRDDREMDNIWSYIESNPCAWDDDNENPL